jgi:hypothetical protein
MRREKLGVTQNNTLGGMNYDNAKSFQRRDRKEREGAGKREEA